MRHMVATGLRSGAPVAFAALLVAATVTMAVIACGALVLLSLLVTA